MSLMIYLLERNIRLSEWENYTDEGIQATRGVSGTTFATMSASKSDKMANHVVSQLSHDKVVQLVASEWEKLPSVMRLLISDKCHNANCSGNARKGIQRLDKLLGGRLLTQEKFELKSRVRVESESGARYVDRRISGSEAGARKKYQLLK
jgi:hypothetical protein